MRRALVLLLLLVAPALPARAAPSACPEHHPGGQAPDILRPALANEARELCFTAYAVLHSGVSRTALASAEHLTRHRLQQARGLERDDRFHAEDDLPEDERARLSDYARSGYDRGHMAPSGDMPTPEAQAESFSLANMVPQSPGSNRCLWEGIESTVRGLANDEGEVWAVTGPIFEGANLQRLNGRVLVPTSLFKAIYLPGRGEAGVYLAPNAPGLAWQAVSLDELGRIAGLDAFPALPAAVKARAMDLPEPRPSNIRGSCDTQPDVAGTAGASPPEQPRAGPAPDRPSSDRSSQERPVPERPIPERPIPERPAPNRAPSPERSVPPERQAPAPGHSADSSGRQRALLILAGLFAAAMVAVLLRTINRR